MKIWAANKDGNVPGIKTHNRPLNLPERSLFHQYQVKGLCNHKEDHQTLGSSSHITEQLEINQNFEAQVEVSFS